MKIKYLKRIYLLLRVNPEAFFVYFHKIFLAKDLGFVIS